MASGMKIMCYDGQTVSRFLRSCATSRAMLEQTHTEWKTYDDSAVLNAVYGLLRWKEKPGWVEIRTPDAHRLRQRTDELHLRMLLAWVDALGNGGPYAANNYIEAQRHLRDEVARVALREVYGDAAQINADIQNETGAAIRRLADIKLGAQVGVAVIGTTASLAFFAASAAGVTGAAAGSELCIMGYSAGASGTVFGAAGLANSVANSVIKSWHEAPQAGVAGIDWGKDGVGGEVGKYVVSEVGGKASEWTLNAAKFNGAIAEDIIREARQRAAHFAQRIANEGMKRNLKKKAARATADLAAKSAIWEPVASQAAKEAAVASAAGRAIPVLFAALDVWGAATEHYETYKASR